MQKEKAKITAKGKTKTCTYGKKRLQRQRNRDESPQPGPSTYYIDDSLDMDTTDDEEVAEEEKSCVCKQLTPSKIRQSSALTFVSWVKCDTCGHWVHFIYETNVRVVRRGDTYNCPHRVC